MPWSGEPARLDRRYPATSGANWRTFFIALPHSLFGGCSGMTAFYNERDPYAAEWLRNLIAAGHGRIVEGWR